MMSQTDCKEQCMMETPFIITNVAITVKFLSVNVLLRSEIFSLADFLNKRTWSWNMCRLYRLIVWSRWGIMFIAARVNHTGWPGFLHSRKRLCTGWCEPVCHVLPTWWRFLLESDERLPVSGEKYGCLHPQRCSKQWQEVKRFGRSKVFIWLTLDYDMII